MRKLAITLAVVGAVVFCAEEAFAQAVAKPERFYVLGSTGWGGYPKFEEGSDFVGWMVGGGAGVPLGGHLALEGVVEQINYRRPDWTGWEGDATTVLARAVILFGKPTTSVRFLLSGSAGHAVDAWHYPANFIDGTGAIQNERTDFGVFGFGAGAQIRVRSHMFIRPDLSFLVGQDGAFYRWGITAGIGF